MAIKALVFDNFGVLMDVVYSSLRQILPGDARGELLKILDNADTGIISADDQLSQIKALLNRYRLNGADEVARAIQRSKRNDELIDFIIKSRTSYKTALLSNVSAVIWNYYTPETLNKLFDVQVLSYQEGMMKPDHRIYQLTCNRLGVQPDECVFTDDNQANVVAAREVGMHGIVFTDNKSYFEELQEIVEHA